MKTPSTARNGIYRAPAKAEATRAATAGLRVTAITLQGVRGKRELLEAISQAMVFPDSFGGNWDALADCLQDLSWSPGGQLLLLQGAADFAAAKPEEFTLFLDILGAAADFWKRHDRVFVVWVEGVTGLAEFSKS